MRHSKAAARYAKSLLDLAIEQNKLDQCRADMELVSATIDGSSELGSMLQSPIVNAKTKEAVLESVFGESIDSLSSSFLRLLTAKGRDKKLHEISHAFLDLYKAHSGIVTAEVVTAVPLDADQRKAIIEAIKSEGKIELEERVDPSVIGGMLLTIGDRRFDASLSSKLQHLKQALS